MDTFIIRTKLQAAIVQAILRQRPRKYAVILVSTTPEAFEREHDNSLIAQISDGAVRVSRELECWSTKAAVLRYLRALLLTRLTNGTVYLASINNLKIAIAAWMLPGLKIRTIDDGTANILSFSKYFTTVPPPAITYRRRALNLVFPRTCSAWFRERTQQHYTIFPGIPNIVPADRLVNISIDWEACLSPADNSLLESRPTNIFIGTALQDRPNVDRQKAFIAKHLDRVDMYIYHPREEPWLTSPKAVRLESPAEAFLLADLKQAGAVRVYHINSTVGYTVAGIPGIETINLIDAFQAETQDGCPAGETAQVPSPK